MVAAPLAPERTAESVHVRAAAAAGGETVAVTGPGS